MDLRPAQVTAAEWLQSHPVGGLLADVGTGKTATVLHALGQDRALVIAPKRAAHLTWPEQIGTWAPGRSWSILHGGKGDYSADLLLTNPEQLEQVLEHALPDTIIFDESQIWRNGINTKRFKLLRKHLPRFGRRWLMTATPAPRTLENLWAQAYLLDDGKRLGKYLTHFRRQYQYQLPFEPYKFYLLPNAEQRIYEAVQDLFYRMSAGAPMLYEQIVPVELPPTAWSAYRELEREFLLTLPSGDVLAANAAVLGNKLRQLVGGACYHADGSWTVIHDVKLRALAELLDSLQGQPLLLFFEYQHELERIRQAFDCRHWIGQGANEATAIESWNTGELTLFPVQASTGSRSLNLQAGGQHVCWFSLPWDREIFDQGNGRLRPHLQPVYAHYLVAKGTIEETSVLSALHVKKATEDAFLHAMETRCK